HYGVILICFAFGEEGIAGAMIVQSSIWLWAALSKCTPHFPSVLCAMTSNSPILKHPRIRKQLYVHFPNDLRPSRSAHRLAQLGTLVEFAFPLLLLFGQGGIATTLGLGIMIIFHVYICSNLPAAVPLEWNAVTIYSGIFLFQNGGWHVYAFDSPLLILWLVTACFLVPLYCNLYPKTSSFLLGMRYYAGNWAYTTWLIRRKAFPKLDKIPRASRFAHEQLESLYPPEIVYGVMQRVEAFRTLHLHGRILPHLIETALDGEEAHSYQIVDGELIAGSLLGWNFGDGHLSGPNLLKAVQEICRLDPGDIRIICVEAQPLFRKQMEWDIFDAACGLQKNGEISVSQLSEMKI
ncbi:MAG: DUF3556 domain-containing protein, partial [Myxococcota bacterium]|nr:DUF3556 domain-containing protein [Myxococcota bacterium]